jgi:hypothetical protein
MTETMTAEARTQTGADFDLDHWYCCDPSTAYCGRDISGDAEGHTDENLCPLCVLAEEERTPCPRCGDARYSP